MIFVSGHGAFAFMSHCIDRSKQATTTYRNPMPNTTVKPIFVIFGSCRFQTTGIGRESTTKSVAKFRAPVLAQPVFWLEQVGPVIGLQSRVKKRIHPTKYEVTTTRSV